ncbi:unnamed protein product [Cyprideis torosa]|uniref:Uncharacterized protein n=1 Tax=Cyprideis torosa TaxID=163714 RepID=A0A7R8WKC4_9CRUS|nr:unnamed protein product [Cyprideis torosa]CAG0903025.1 unnamed protein product [Cyprideis torosa]
MTIFPQVPGIMSSAVEPDWPSPDNNNKSDVFVADFEANLVGTASEHPALERRDSLISTDSILLGGLSAEKTENGNSQDTAQNEAAANQEDSKVAEDDEEEEVEKPVTELVPKELDVFRSESPETEHLLSNEEKGNLVHEPSLSSETDIKSLTAQFRRTLSKQPRSPPSQGSSYDRRSLLEGVEFRAGYLGSTQLVCEGHPTKASRLQQAQEVIGRIKAPEGETQPSTTVDLLVSMEKVTVCNSRTASGAKREVILEHSLRFVSYIADVGDLVVLMARRRRASLEKGSSGSRAKSRMLCHVFQSVQSKAIAECIGRAFQLSYMEFLESKGIENDFVRDLDYQEVLNSQEIFKDELSMFAERENQKDVVIPKAKGEILGVALVESGWGSMLPTVIVANLLPGGPAARCGRVNIGDQIIAVNGVSLVGLPLAECEAVVKNVHKSGTAVKLTLIPCAPVLEVRMKRPSKKYPLGFSVQDGVICSLFRGGIAERGGVRVGHRIIEINEVSVVAVPHDKIVEMLSSSVGLVSMKSMPTAMFRMLTGQETPSYV